MALAVSFFCCTSAWAQTTQPDDVHIEPRPTTTKPPDAATSVPGMPPGLSNEGVKLPTIRTETDLVLVSVTVTDPLNRLVTGLERDNFKLFEANQAQEIKHFSNEDAPIS